MPLTSRRFLDKEIKERILQLFWVSFLKINNYEKAIDFLDDLLSKTESLMIAKRLSIAFMLVKGYDYQEIDELIKVSQTTISKVNAVLENGQGYKTVVNEVIKEEKWQKFWNNLEEIFGKILPPAKGTNWKEVRKRQWQRIRKNQKPF